MGQAPFIARASRVLKSSSGLNEELFFSRDFHSDGVPLLISPLLLRGRDLGQIDLARMKKTKGGWIIEVGEVKSSQVGAEGMERFQKQRIFSSQRFLSGIFGVASRLVFLIR